MGKRREREGAISRVFLLPASCCSSPKPSHHCCSLSASPHHWCHDEITKPTDLYSSTCQCLMYSFISHLYEWKRGIWNPLFYVVSVNNNLRRLLRGRNTLYQGVVAAGGRNSRPESLRSSEVTAQHWLPLFEDVQ